MPRPKPAIPRVARSIYLPAPLNERLSAEADRRGLSANDLVILALEQSLSAGDPRPAAPMPPESRPPRDFADFD